MDESIFLLYQSWFKDYAKQFYTSDSKVQMNIRLKEDHTFRVCKNIEDIAKSLNSQKIDISLARTIALFHDIGRFEQLKKYGIFDDHSSENHASLGLRVLEKTGVLSNLSEEESFMVCRAILFHNRYRLPHGESSVCQVYSKLIRDADKLDILKVITNHFKERRLYPNSALDFNLSDSAQCSPEIIDDILSRRMARIDKLRTQSDMKLMYLSWIFDINFPATLTFIEQRGYWDRILESLPDTKEVLKVRDCISGCIERRQLSCIKFTWRER